MKKILIFILLLIIIPYTVNAKDDCSTSMTIKNIELVRVEGKANELSEPTIDNQLVNVNLKLSDLGDKVTYKVLLKNNSEEVFKINENKLSTNSKYIDCYLESLDNSKIIGAKKEKEVLLTVEYKKQVDDDLFENNEYRLNEEVTIYLYNNKTNNPVTSTGVISLILILTTLVIITIMKKKRLRMISLLLLSIIIPISVNAVCNATIKVKSNILFEKTPVAPINNCHFDGELVQGAEYTNGQYVYRYLQEAKNSDAWKDINDGWGMRLINRSSSDPVTTPICTHINSIPVTSMAWAFYRNSASTIDLSSFNTMNITSMQSMFNSISADIDVSMFDTSNVTNFSGMFIGYSGSLDISSFNTKSAQNMSTMFSQTTFDNIDITHFNTSNVTDLHQMFIKAKINNLNLSNLNTSKAQNMKEMFREFEGNVNLSGINTSSVTNMQSMFMLSKTNNIDFSSFDTRNVTNMTGMFDNAEMEIIDISSFSINSLDKINSLFIMTTARIIDISGFHITKPIEFNNMFSSASNLETIYASESFNPSFLVSNEGYNFGSNTKLKGMNGTSCARVDYSNDLLYMRIDGGESAPGCFTAK